MPWLAVTSRRPPRNSLRDVEAPPSLSPRWTPSPPGERHRRRVRCALLITKHEEAEVRLRGHQGPSDGGIGYNPTLSSLRRWAQITTRSARERRLSDSQISCSSSTSPRLRPKRSAVSSYRPVLQRAERDDGHGLQPWRRRVRVVQHVHLAHQSAQVRRGPGRPRDRVKRARLMAAAARTCPTLVKRLRRPRPEPRPEPTQPLWFVLLVH